MSKLLMVASICLAITVFQRCTLAQATRAENDSLIDALDLSRPELSAVKSAADAHDYAGARKAFADYLRSRTNVVWQAEPERTRGRGQRGGRALADDALVHRFTISNVPWQFKDGINWKFNATAQPDSKDALTHEWTWQLNRHTAWPALAAAYHATGDKRYATELASEIADWCAKNPEPVEVNNNPYSTWRTIEAGIRMFGAWPETFFSMLKSPDVFPDDVMLAMVDAMRAHADYLEKYPTHGNWKTMESNGLFHVGTLFPEFKDSAKWRTDGINRQRDELNIQVYPDGPQKELAPGYHNVALRSFLGVYTLAVLNKIDIPAGYKEAMERMFDTDMWQMMPDRTSANFNDSGRGDVRGMLEQGLALFPNRDDWKWIVSNGDQGQPPKETSHYFPWPGWAVMRSGWDWDARTLIMEGGPFGMGHQHEDKLSFILDGYGSHLIAECGVYSYDASPMRRYCTSARGHNVMSVDGLQQHRREQPRESFISNKPLDLAWSSDEHYDYVESSYGNDKDEPWGPQDVRGFVHTRRVLFVKPDYFVVIDTGSASDDKEHSYEAYFHLDGADSLVDKAAKSVTTTNQYRANISVLPLPVDGLDLRVIKGQKDPEMLGWIADTTYTMRAVPTAYFTQKGKGSVNFLYVFAPTPMGKPCPVERVETAAVPDAKLAASIVFKDNAVYGRAKDVVALKADGTVQIKRADGTTFSAGHGAR